jgi:serine/threonine protein phosphatase PrpC
MIAAERAHLNVSAASHPGRSGKNNEDRFGVSAHWFDQNGKLPSLLAVVADGIGGHLAGEVAAEMAVETISREIAKYQGDQPLPALVRAISTASQTIKDAAHDNPEYNGMGSTCACVWVVGQSLYAAYVGDSRVYLVRQNQIYCLTRDHTWVQEAIDRGVLMADQARKHPNAHVIRRYLGSSKQVEPDIRLYPPDKKSETGHELFQGLQLFPGDLVLLCTDGLTDLVDDDEIKQAFATHPQDQAIEALIGLANLRGGHDNITLISLQVPSGEEAAVAPAKQSSRLSWRAVGLAVGVLLGVLVLVGLAVYGYVNSGAEQERTVTSSPTVTQYQVVTPPGLLLEMVTPIETAPYATLQPTLPSTDNLMGENPATTLTPWPTNTLYP